MVFHISEPDVTKGKDRSIGGGDDASAPKKTRPEITQKGTEIIGALRTEALVKSLEVNACDDMTLIGLLVLAFDAKNVTVQSDRPTHSTRTKLVQSITDGGRLTHDAERLRVVARQMLAAVLSCSIGRSDSGLVARIAGDALGADAHIGNMATEDFLGCLSKAGSRRSDRACAFCRARAPRTRAPKSSSRRRARPTSIPRPCSRSPKRNSRSMPNRHGNIRGVAICREDDREGVGDDVCEGESKDEVSDKAEDDLGAEQEPDDEPAHDGAADENAHLDHDVESDEPRVTQARSRSAPPRHAAVA